jgi:AbrB family looped-hinge helix DNA binding protein
MPSNQKRLLKITVLGRYNRTTVPGEVRKLLNLKEGSKVAWYYENGKIIVENPEEDDSNDI